MRLHKRILLAVIALVVMAASSYARHILRVSVAAPHSRWISRSFIWLGSSRITPTKAMYTSQNIRLSQSRTLTAVMRLAYFARLDGAVLEADLPYLSYETISNDLCYPKSLWINFLRNDVSPGYDELYQLGRYYASREVIPAASAESY